jgi:hypothetical protein
MQFWIFGDQRPGPENSGKGEVVVTIFTAGNDILKELKKISLDFSKKRFIIVIDWINRSLRIRSDHQSISARGQ